MDLFHIYEWKDLENVSLHKRMLAKEMVYDFLARPNRELDEVRGNILKTKLLPPIKEEFVKVK